MSTGRAEDCSPWTETLLRLQDEKVFMDELPDFTENQMKVLFAVGRNNQPRLEKDEELFNQRQLAEKEDINMKTFGRGKPWLQETGLIEEKERGGNGGMVKLVLTEKGMQVFELLEALQEILAQE